MIWKEIEGYKFRYRISDQAEVQKFSTKGWETLKTSFKWNRLHVRLKRKEGTQAAVAVVNLMDEYFFDGAARKNGWNICHKDGCKTDCAFENLYLTTQSEIGKRWGAKGSRKAVSMSKNGREVIYPSLAEAARKNGLTVPSLRRRMLGEVYDEKGRVFKYV